MQKTKKLKESELAQALRDCRRALSYAFLFTFCLNILMLLLPIYSLQVLDRVISSHSYETLMVLSIITVAGLLFYGLFYMVRAFTLQAIAEWLEHKLAPRLLRLAVIKSSLGTPAGASQMQRDLINIKAFVTNGLAVILDIPWSFIFLLVVYMISPVLGFVTVIGLVILIGFALINEFMTKGPLDKAQEATILSTHTADIAARNAEAVEAMGMMPAVIDNWQQQNELGQKASNTASKRATIIQSISRSLRLIVQIAVTGVGAALALQNELTVGGMIASSILVGRALGPFDAAIGVWKGFLNARDSHKRLEGMLSTLPELRGTMKLPAPIGQLKVEGVFYQPQGSTPILKNINFALEPGESLGIIGPSAAGKSTLAKLIIGILQPNHGSVRLDGVETFKWNREDFGQYVGYMPQQVDLFNGTIKDNIARMDRFASDEQVIEAAKMAGCHEMILRLPHGYESTFQQGNQSLSPGQRQRIGLARALFSHPRFVVLDEPNGNLDGEGERALVQALARMREAGITYIVVAHRPSLVSGVDKVLMLRGGMVENFGWRDEVLKQYVKPVSPDSVEGAS